jgi:4-amino-4-deoxy-L-arabinose transferase-like glycosyltransferase
MTPLQGARAAIAGALTMLVGVWIMTNDQSEWDERQLAIGLLMFFAIILLLLGINIKREAENGNKEE